MLEDVSAASFCVGDAIEEHAIDEYLQCCQPANARFGVCGVGGALHINTFKLHDNAPAVPPPPAAPTAPPSVVSADSGLYPVSMLHAHEPDASFMDKLRCGRASGCGGKLPLGFGHSALTSLAVCMLFSIVCATAVPSVATAFGGVGMGADTAPQVGGAIGSRGTFGSGIDVQYPVNRQSRFGSCLIFSYA
ncbi:hypothetical protein CYMTET_17987 [Cymbomonas tetramitiformis]|uniref:Uncharacterized protein n=1 Tax=Cymbomonas tetramitiformis TaxID=36881 RepID=A0AAE0G9K5_9CHLO|nr:hypothetical protein CYMTET_17987 [Cymbomonas tetramitiformis]